MANSRSSVGLRRISHSSASDAASNFSSRRQFAPASRLRTALSRLSSKVRPTAMTSPVAFICVESRRLALSNLSKGKRAILVTT